VTGLVVVGRVLPQSIVFVVAEGATFDGAPSDWITVAEYKEMINVGRANIHTGSDRPVDSRTEDVYDNEEVHTFR
jgi:hypothetical protein